jgi:hypothetical protein
VVKRSVSEKTHQKKIPSPGGLVKKGPEPAAFLSHQARRTGRRAETMTAMLTNIPWSHFFLTAGAALVLYYLAILLRYYRHDIMRQLRRLFVRAGLPAHRPSPSQESILGAALPEAAPPLASASDLQVAPAQQQQPFPPGAAAFLEEVGSLLESAADTRMGKEEFLSFLRLLDERHMPSPDERQVLQRYLLEHGPSKLSFPLTAADLAAPEHEPSSLI